MNTATPPRDHLLARRVGVYAGIGLLALALALSGCSALGKATKAGKKAGKRVQKLMDPKPIERVEYTPAPYIVPEHYIDVEEINLCYIEEGEGDTVIFLHGFGGTLEGENIFQGIPFFLGQGGSIDDWTWAIPHFQKKYHTIALDWPGFGKSEKPEYLDYTIEMYTRFLLKFMDAKNIEKASLVGQDFGGAAALLFALRYPERVDRLVLVAPAVLWKPPFQEKGGLQKLTVKKLKRLVTSEMMSDGIKEPFYNADMVPPERIQGALDLFYSVDFEKTENAVMLTTHDLMRSKFKKRLKEVAVPTFIVWGWEDDLYSYTQGYTLNEKIKDSYFYIVPAAGHFPQVERPVPFNKAVDIFLQDLAHTSIFRDTRGTLTEEEKAINYINAVSTALPAGLGGFTGGLSGGASGGGGERKRELPEPTDRQDDK